MDLYEAAKHGNTDALKSAVEQGCDVNQRNIDGKTPLWLAAQSGQAEACRFLIAQRASMDVQNLSILEVAVQEGHADVVALLWPRCDAAREHRSLESAISLGFHDIADFLIGSGKFEYPESGFVFPERPSTAFQQWERFLFVRQRQRLPLHHQFLDYALLLATKADRNAGLRLAEFLLGESMASVNCKVMVNDEIETPLTAAAEKGNMEILAALIDQPNTNVTICGKYDWPALLHLLASPLSISTERGRAIARRLSYKIPSNRIFFGRQRIRLKSAFNNVLRYGDDSLVKQVIDIVHGQAGIDILPLLIRANEADGVKWVLNSDAVDSLRPPPDFWVLLCQYFQSHEDQNALELFTSVAEFLVEKKIWNQLILKCLYMRNFSFIRQFFYQHTVPPKEVIEETLLGLHAASANQYLIKEWDDQEFAVAALWDANYCGLWTNPAFQRLLFISSAKNINGPDPHRTSRGRSELVDIPHIFFNDLSSERQRISVITPFVNPTPNSHNPILQDYQAQLTLLDQQQRKRRLLEQDTMCLLSWAIRNLNAPLLDTLLLSRQININSQDNHGRTPLMYALGMNDRSSVEKLLNHEDIDVNFRDDQGRTAIFYAAQREDLDIIQLFVGTQKVDYSIRNKDNQTVQDFAKKTKKKKDIIAALSS